MSDRQYKFSVQMGCGGCSSTIEQAMKILSGESLGPILYHGYIVQGTNVVILCAAGVKNHSISLEEQTVSVVADPSLSYETVLEAIKAKGKNVRSGEADGIAQSV